MTADKRSHSNPADMIHLESAVGEDWGDLISEGEKAWQRVTLEVGLRAEPHRDAVGVNDSDDVLEARHSVLGHRFDDAGRALSNASETAVTSLDIGLLFRRSERRFNGRSVRFSG